MYLLIIGAFIVIVAITIMSLSGEGVPVGTNTSSNTRTFEEYMSVAPAGSTRADYESFLVNMAELNEYADKKEARMKATEPKEEEVVGCEFQGSLNAQALYYMQYDYTLRMAYNGLMSGVYDNINAGNISYPDAYLRAAMRNNKRALVSTLNSTGMSYLFDRLRIAAL